MKKNRNYRVKPDQLRADRQALLAVQRLKDYEPRHKDYTIAALEALIDALNRAEQHELYLESALVAARDARVAAEWALHDGALGTKDQVVAQYGPDSDEIQSLGLKKKSKYRRATSRPAQGT